MVNGVEEVEENEIKSLSLLCFVLSSCPVEPALGAISPQVPHGSLPVGGNVNPKERITRTFIELCYDEVRLFGQDNPHTSGCRRHRFIEHDDLTTEAGVKRAFEGVDVAQKAHRGHLTVWTSIPLGNLSTSITLQHGGKSEVTVSSSRSCGIV